MVSTPEGIYQQQSNVTWPIFECKNPSTSKSLCQISEVLDVKQNTYILR